MADTAHVAATPVPEEDDFDLFGPGPGEASQPSQQGQAAATQGPQPVPQQQAPVPPAVNTVGLDPQLQQLMLQMMQMQQQTLQVMARMDVMSEEERKQRLPLRQLQTLAEWRLEVRPRKLQRLHRQRLLVLL